MRRVWYGVGLVVGLGLFVPSCGSDSDPPSGTGGTSGTRGDSGPDSSGSGGTGGAAGSAGQVGSGGAGAGGGGQGGTGGTTGGGAAGSAGSAGTAGDGSMGTAGDGSMGSSGSAGDDGGVDGGDAYDAGPDACGACPNGACVDGGADGGVCVECTSSAHCTNPKPQCDLERNVCVECVSTPNDTCPSGQYCAADKRCVKGCKDGSTCASGICTVAHDCARCVSDGECSAQKVCGSGVCGTACSAGGPTDQCGTGTTCCEPRCVRTDRDIANCKGCGTICGGKQFCGKTACTNATIANVCNLGLVTAVLDGGPADDQATATILAGLEARCAPAPTTRSVPQPSADVINPLTGRVVVPGGEMLVFAGGRFLQKGVGFLEDQRSLPVYSGGGTFPNVAFLRSVDGTTIASSVYEEPGSHDIIVIEVGREVSTGTLSLVAYGFHGNGTRAAAWYFANQMLPNLSNYPDAWYVYTWVDTNPNLNPDSGDTFTLVSSGT
jgi:hypothetical protein